MEVLHSLDLRLLKETVMGHNTLGWLIKIVHTKHTPSEDYGWIRQVLNSDYFPQSMKDWLQDVIRLLNLTECGLLDGGKVSWELKRLKYLGRKMEESGKKSNPPSQEKQEENPPLENNHKWTREFSWRKDMKKMTPWNVLDYNTKHLHLSSFGHEMEEMLLKEVAKYMLKSEYRIYSMAFALKIPYRYTVWIYFMTFKQMSMSSSAPCSLSEFDLEVGRRLLQFARNMYFR